MDEWSVSPSRLSSGGDGKVVLRRRIVWLDLCRRFSGRLDGRRKAEMKAMLAH